MDQQAQTPERRLSLQSRHEVVGQGDALEGGAEHELTGMEDERTVVGHLDELGEVLLALLRVDEGRGVVAEHPEVAVDVEVDRRRLHRVRPERVDHDTPGGELLADGHVGEDHGGEHIGADSRARAPE